MMMGLTEANSDLRSHSLRKGGYPPPSLMIPQLKNAQEHLGNLMKEGLCGGAQWEVTSFFIFDCGQKQGNGQTLKWLQLDIFQTENRGICLLLDMENRHSLSCGYRELNMRIQSTKQQIIILHKQG